MGENRVKNTQWPSIPKIILGLLLLLSTVYLDNFRDYLPFTDHLKIFLASMTMFLFGLILGDCLSKITKIAGDSRI